jgi:hypothetical protein
MRASRGQGAINQIPRPEPLAIDRRAHGRDGFIYHFGVGPIATNSVTTVRNDNRAVGGWLFDGGYYVSGVGLGVSALVTTFVSLAPSQT